jgi:phenylalanyl-tRNA synthetase beta chain
VIADAERAVAIAGIIGGMGTEVTADSRDILLEAAYFDPANTRRTCRRLKVGTDSSYRFERGIDLEAVAEASSRATRLIVETAGGTIAKGVLDSNPKPRASHAVTLRQARLESLAGMPVAQDEARGYLEALGCRTLERKPEALRVQVPSWRRGDLEREVDLIEEVARLHGYHHVPAETAMRAQIPPRSRLEVVTDRVRDLCTGLGYFECWTDSLVDPRWPAPAVWTAEPPLTLDPRSVLREDHSVLRNSLLVSLLNTHHLNQDRRTGEVRIFECGKVFLPKSGAARPDERHVLGVLDERGFTALADLLGRLGEALEWTGARLEIRRAAAGEAPAFLAPEAACRVTIVADGSAVPVGWAGLATAEICRAFDLKRAPAVAEVDLAGLVQAASAPPRYRELPTQPEVVRDVAVVVDEGLSWGEIERFATECGPREPLRDCYEPVRFLSVFRGKQIGAGKKSVAFSVVYRAAERSLTDEEVNAAHQRFVEELLKTFRATLRA